MTAPTILRPAGYMGHDNGPTRYTMAQGREILGRRVEIRDWYGEIRCTVTELHENELTGFLLGIGFTTDSGHAVPMFKLNLVREIEVLDA